MGKFFAKQFRGGFAVPMLVKNLRIPPELHAILSEFCRRTRRDEAETIRAILWMFFDEAPNAVEADRKGIFMKANTRLSDRLWDDMRRERVDARVEAEFDRIATELRGISARRTLKR